MNFRFPRISVFAAALAALSAALSAGAETRMAVSSPSTPILPRPSAAAPSLGNASQGEILFVSSVEGEWAAISPPERISLWIGSESVGGNRILAKNVPVRSGPGTQHDSVGSLSRGALVMTLGAEGQWTQIAPPSSAVLWVKAADLSPVRARGDSSAPELPPPPATPSAPTNRHADARPETHADAQPPPETHPEPAQPAAQTPIPVVVQPSKPLPPSRPSHAAAAPAPHAPPALFVPPAPPSPPAPPTPPPPRVAPSQPSSTPAPAIPLVVPAASEPVFPEPAPGAGDAQPASPALLRQLELVAPPVQGTAVQLEGELRAAPFSAAATSRYKLISTDGLFPKTLCLVHGDPVLLRNLAGRRVSLRGQQYWVVRSKFPVVVVSQIAPLSP